VTSARDHVADAGGAQPPSPLTLALLVGALTFNTALCFLNTNVMAVNDTMVMGSEVVLVATALYLGLGRNAAPYIVLAVFMSYAAMLMAMRPALDPKAVRDFLIPIAFYLLGRSCRDPRLADRAALISGLIVVAFGLFEFLALDVYVKYFNIIKYYVARGTVAPSDVKPDTGALFASGIRPDARTLLPFLGPHRASSVFLEPISTGNFGAIIYIWCLNRKEMNKRWLTMATGIGAIILSDSRFGANVCIVATIAWFFRAAHTALRLAGCALLRAVGAGHIRLHQRGGELAEQLRRPPALDGTVGDFAVAFGCLGSFAGQALLIGFRLRLFTQPDRADRRDRLLEPLHLHARTHAPGLALQGQRRGLYLPADARQRFRLLDQDRSAAMVPDGHQRCRARCDRSGIRC